MKNHHTTHDEQILQTPQRSILQTTTFLSSDYTGTELISSNPDPTTIQTLPTSTSKTLKTNTNHTLLPTTLHPLLNRLYIPHKTFLAEQYHLQKDKNAGKENDPHPVHEQRFWVGMRLPRRAYPTRDAFLDALDRSIEMLGANIVVADPGEAGPPRAFLMEVRGYFRVGWMCLRRRSGMWICWGSL